MEEFWHSFANYLVLDEKGILRFMKFALFRFCSIVFMERMNIWEKQKMVGPDIKEDKSLYDIETWK